MEEMCIRCQQAEAPGSLGLCAACAVNTRVEVTDGLKRLGDYLVACAAFERWLRDNPGPSPGS
jgi:hypothetical protein